MSSLSLVMQENTDLIIEKGEFVKHLVCRLIVVQKRSLMTVLNMGGKKILLKK